MASGRLNIFQRLVRRWDAAHPYNAVQAMRIVGVASPDRWRAAWDQTLASLGLGIARAHGSRFWFDASAGPSPPLTAGFGDDADLEAFLSAEMNRPFAPGSPPFRPFCFSAGARAPSYFVGLTYHHWVADSVSVRMLMREWFYRTFEPARARRTPLRLPSKGYWGLFGPTASHWDLPAAVLDTLRWSSRLKRVRRLRPEPAASGAVGFSLHAGPDGLAHQLRPAARAHGLTLNDVFLAAAAEACHRHVPAEVSPRRPDLAVGTIVDLRPPARRDLSDTFGLFLGFTTHVFRARTLTDWPALLAATADQSRRLRASRAAQGSMVRMSAGALVEACLPSSAVARFYRKRLPLAGGISNVDLNRTWAAEFHPDPVLDYVRVSPTGPMMPIVFTPSTFGRRFHVGVTRRTSAVGEAAARAVVECFLARLQRIAERADPFAR